MWDGTLGRQSVFSSDRKGPPDPTSLHQNPRLIGKYDENGLMGFAALRYLSGYVAKLTDTNVP